MRRGFRSKRAEIRSINAAHAFVAAASEKPDAYEKLAGLLRPEPRARIRRPVDGAPSVPLEADVVRAVSQLLAVHPKVLFAVRQNSGAASYEAATGKFAPIWFYHILTSQPVTITDFWGLLRDGKPFAMEAKRADFKEPRTERELRQAAFLMLIRNCGGVGGFVRDADEANALLA